MPNSDSLDIGTSNLIVVPSSSLSGSLIPLISHICFISLAISVLVNLYDLTIYQRLSPLLKVYSILWVSSAIALSSSFTIPKLINLDSGTSSLRIVSAGRMLFSFKLLSLQIFLISFTISPSLSQYLRAIDQSESPNSTVYDILFVSSLTATTVSVSDGVGISATVFLQKVQPVKLVKVIVPARINDAAFLVLSLS